MRPAGAGSGRRAINSRGAHNRNRAKRCSCESGESHETGENSKRGGKRKTWLRNSRPQASRPAIFGAHLSAKLEEAKYIECGETNSPDCKPGDLVPHNTGRSYQALGGPGYRGVGNAGGLTARSSPSSRSNIARQCIAAALKPDKMVGGMSGIHGSIGRSALSSPEASPCESDNPPRASRAAHGACQAAAPAPNEPRQDDNS